MKKKKKPPRMPHLYRANAKKKHQLPGSLIYTGTSTERPVLVTIFDYNDADYKEKQIDKIEDCFAYDNRNTVSWINIDGLWDTELIGKVGQGFNIHPLTMEDILSTSQRPKYEVAENCIFVVLRMLTFNDETGSVESEQVSFILTSNYVLSFQENTGDVFDHVRNRIRTAKGKIRKMGPDYLLYSLIDSIVDNYFVVLEKLSEKIESVEEALLNDPNEQCLRQLHLLHRELISVRKSVWPLRELVNGLVHSESGLITDSTERYFKDVYDHSIQIIDTIESFRDVMSGLKDMYMSVVSNRMNAVMKVLTIIATIFIPLTFIVGVYGMNFKHMPELDYKWGYASVWVVMILTFIGMLFYFKHKRWF
jgi:magnesium transporter